MDSRLATVTHEGEDIRLVVEGDSNILKLGVSGSRSSIRHQAGRLSNTVFKGNGDMVVSGYRNFVWQPRISDFARSSSQGMQHKKVESQVAWNAASAKQLGPDSVPHVATSGPFEQERDDHSQSKTEPEDAEPTCPVLDENSLCGSNMYAHGKEGKMTFVTRSSGVVVHGSLMDVFIGGDDQDVAMPTDLDLEPSEEHDTGMPDMDFRAENCDVCVRGCRSTLIVGNDVQTAGGRNQPQKRNVSTGGRNCSCPMSTSSATCVCVQESDNYKCSGYCQRTSPIAMSLPPLVTQDEWHNQPDPQPLPARDYIDINSIPIAKLPFGVRRELSLLLDVKQLTGADWRSVADSFGVSYSRICHLDVQESPTMSLLHSLQGKGTDVGQLIAVLAKLDRKDAVIELTERLESYPF